MLPLPQVIAVPLSISFVKVHVKYSLHYYYYYYYHWVYLVYFEVNYFEIYDLLK
jgi:hypothetical protein